MKVLVDLEVGDRACGQSRVESASSHAFDMFQSLNTLLYGDHSFRFPRPIQLQGFPKIYRNVGTCLSSNLSN